jgi:hypothetical protein
LESMVFENEKQIGSGAWAFVGLGDWLGWL